MCVTLNLSSQNGVTALDVARVHDRERVCELLSKTMTPPVPLTTPLSKEANLSTQQTTPATPEERRHTFEVCFSFYAVSYTCT